VTSLMSVEPKIRRVSLTGLRPRSTVCFRTYRPKRQAKRGRGNGSVTVRVNLRRPGIGSINEVLAQHAPGAWKKLVILHQGALDAQTEPPKPSKAGLYVLTGSWRLRSCSQCSAPEDRAIVRIRNARD
jgi:hypothetical protein